MMLPGEEPFRELFRLLNKLPMSFYVGLLLGVSLSQCVSRLP